MGKLSKTDREWQESYHQRNFGLHVKKAQSLLLRGDIGILNKRGFIPVVVAVQRYSHLKQNMTAVAVGQVSIVQSSLG